MFFSQFKEISFAYETLSNPEKRETYDRYGLQGLKEGGGPGGGRCLFEIIKNYCRSCQMSDGAAP